MKKNYLQYEPNIQVQSENPKYENKIRKLRIQFNDHEVWESNWGEKQTQLVPVEYISKREKGTVARKLDELYTNDLLQS